MQGPEKTTEELAFENLCSVIGLDIQDKRAIHILHELIDTERNHLQGLSLFTPDIIETMLNAVDKKTEKKGKGKGKVKKDKAEKKLEGWSRNELENMLNDIVQLRNLSEQMLESFEVGDFDKASRLLEESRALFIRYNAAQEKVNTHPLPSKFLEAFPPYNGLPALAYLRYPIQRIPRLIMLSGEVVKHFPNSAQDKRDEISEMGKMAKQTADQINNFLANATTKQSLDYIKTQNWNERGIQRNTKESIFLTMILDEIEKKIERNEKTGFHLAFANLYNMVGGDDPSPEIQSIMAKISEFLIPFDENCALDNINKEVQKIQKESKLRTSGQKRRHEEYTKERSVGRSGFNPDALEQARKSVQPQHPPKKVRPLPTTPGAPIITTTITVQPSSTSPAKSTRDEPPPPFPFVSPPPPPTTTREESAKSRRELLHKKRLDREERMKDAGFGERKDVGLSQEKETKEEKGPKLTGK